MRTALVLLAALCWSCAAESTITIVSTNDIHSSTDNFPSLAHLVDSLRTRHPDLLLVDAGDRRTGNPYVDRAEKPGYPIIALMNELRYDLATFGNHEFDAGTGTLAQNAADADFPMILANISTNGDTLPQPEPYRIIEVKGVKLLFLGLTTISESGHPDGFPESFGKATFTPPIETALRHANLRDSADVLIGLTHIGYEEDTMLAHRMPEFDLIIGGHSHTQLDSGRRHNGVLVTQTRRGLEYAGITTVKLKGGKVASIENRLVRLDTIPRAARYEQLEESFRNDPGLMVVVGEAAREIGQTGMRNLMADAMRECSGADLAFCNAGGVRLAGMPQGEITCAQIYMAEPFDNTAYVASMTLDEIKTLILNKFNSTGKESHTLDLYPSGASYEIITSAEGEGTDVIFNLGGKAGRKGLYKVALSNYVYKVYDFPKTHPYLDSGKAINLLMREYITAHSPVDPGETPRVAIGR